MCFYSVIPIPKGKSPTHNCDACCFTSAGILRHIQHIAIDRHKHVQIRTSRRTHTHTITFRKLTACSRCQVKCCFGSPSQRPLPPLLFSPLLISLTPKDKETHCTMGHHLSPQEQLLETFHCQKISSQFIPPSPSLYLLPHSVFLPRPAAIPSFFPLFLYNASLHGSQWALLQVRLPLAQAHLYRLQQRRWSTVFYFMLRPWQTFLPMFLTMGSFSPMERHGNFPLILISSPVL